MFDKIKTFLHDNKGKLLVAVIFVVGGLSATGVNIPASFVDLAKTLVNGL